MKTPKHSISEDILALVCATVFVSLGLSMYQSLGLLMGGTSGLALMMTHMIDLPFSTLFFVINMPFYFLAIKQLGWRFTINTFASVTLVSLLTDNIHRFVSLDKLDPIFGALAGGLMIGMGLLIMFRHKSSLGGLGILALYMQERYKIPAGKFQIVVDCSIVAISFLIVSPTMVAISVFGAFIMNLILAVNHKPGRYQIGDVEALSEFQDEEACIEESVQTSAELDDLVASK